MSLCLQDQKIQAGSRKPKLEKDGNGKKRKCVEKCVAKDTYEKELDLKFIIFFKYLKILFFFI